MLSLLFPLAGIRSDDTCKNSDILIILSDDNERPPLLIFHHRRCADLVSALVDFLNKTGHLIPWDISSSIKYHRGLALAENCGHELGISEKYIRIAMASTKGEWILFSSE